VAFYGIGNDSNESHKTTFGYDTASAGSGARLQLFAKTSVGGTLDFMTTESDGGDTDRLALPSLAPSYLRSAAFAEFDSRTSPGYTREGGLYRAQFSQYEQVNGDAFSFGRVDAEVQRFVPLFGDRQVIALRATAASTFTGADQAVPYYLLPELGGHHALRGYSSFRFRDRNRLLLSGEYRWTAGPLADMSLFMDAGSVAARFGDLAHQELRTSFGVGITVHTPSATMARLEVAHSREGLGVLISFGPSF